MTTASPLPCVVSQAERHFHTDELLLPAGQPLCFLLAKADCDAPAPQDMTAVILRPGMAFLIKKGVWHSAAHGFGTPAPYYYIADVYSGEPTVWHTVGDIIVSYPQADT